MAAEIIHCYGGERTTMTVINADDRVEMSAGGTGGVSGELITAGKTPFAAQAAEGEGREPIRELTMTGYRICWRAFEERMPGGCG